LQDERLAFWERVSRELSSGLDLTSVTRRTLALSLQCVDASGAALLLIDQRHRLGMATVLCEHKFRPADLTNARALLASGPCQEAIDSREPVSVAAADLGPDETRGLFSRCDLSTSSLVVVPLIVPHRVVGVLICIHLTRSHFDEEKIENLRLVASQAGMALENARLFEAEEHRRHLTDMLGEIARKLTSTLDLDEVLQLILEHLGRVVVYDSAAIFLLHGKDLRTRAWKGFPSPEAVQDLSFRVDGNQILARVVASPEPIVCDDVQQDPVWENVRGVPPIRGWIGAPLRARGEVIGALTVDSNEPGTYGEEDARVVAAFADHVSIAVANARLWHQIRRRLDELAFLYQTSQTLTASLYLDEVLRSLLESVREHFHVEAASVALIDEETRELVFRVAVGEAADYVTGMRLQPGEGIAGWVAKSGQPLFVPSVRTDVRYYNGVDQATGFRTDAIMAVPIRLGEEALGVIEAINPQEDAVDDDDLRLLLNVATLAASAIQNARLFTRARDAEQRYASLFENSADPIIITDESGTITDVNRKVCEMLGYESKAFVGRDIATLFQEPEPTQAQLTEALEGESTPYTINAIDSSRAVVPFEVRATRVFHGARPYIQWVCHDISERLELEQAREELTHMIVHDLRNPLTSIMSGLELLRKSLVGGHQTIPLDQVFEATQRSGDRLYFLIASLLDMARLEGGQVELHTQPIDVATLAREIVDQLQPIAATRSLNLTSQVEEGLPPLSGDRELLNRVVLNLLDNAMKFTPSGGEVRLDVCQADEGWVTFAVTDTGPGIAPEHHQHVFDRFSRVTNNRARGTGLGLAMCKLAVEAHGGRIWVESEIGQGSTFKFVLPI
jgi:PAS domain S-box-containing protein